MNVKKAFLPFLVLVHTVLAAQYSITGHLAHLNNQMVYLKFVNDKLEKQTDSVFAVNGRFVFTGKLTEPTHGALSSADEKLDAQFFFENGTTTLTGDILAGNQILATGANSTKEYNQYLALDFSNMLLRDSLSGKSVMERMRGDTLAAAETWKQLNEVVQQSKEIERSFLITHNNSPVSAFIIYQLYLHPGAKAKGDSLMNLMTLNVRQSKYARCREKVFEQRGLAKPGMPVLSFSLPDTSGKMVSTTNYAGKYYLIDFWASWCKPCRAENPNMLKAYQKYHLKGFDILAVSLDDDRASWINAIVNDNLPWAQVSDLKNWESMPAKLYAVQGIPTNFLIDKNGIIIAKELRGIELHAKLKELLGE